MSAVTNPNLKESTATVAVDEDIRRAVRDFLLLEAEFLDDRRFRDWLNLLAPEIDYRMPVRVTRAEGGSTEFSADSYHFIENRHRLELRVERLETGAAWAENPPSRTRHFISNIRVAAGGRAGEVQAKSNLLLYRTRGNAPTHDLLSAERRDLLRLVEDGWKLTQRTILLDQTTLATHNLSVFL